MSHILVIANETAASSTLLDAVRSTAGSDDLVTVIAPVNEPNQGYVVYEDTRRASAGRRLDRTLTVLRESGVPTQGFVVETGPGASGQGRTGAARAAGRRDRRLDP